MGEGVNHAGTWGKRIPGRGNCKCESLEGKNAGYV
jgi:hypothetical protein